MSVSDYQACNPSQKLKGAPFAPAWGKPLADAMKTRGLAAYEEDLVALLMSDLCGPQADSF